jgi:hypothetical protein
MVFKFYNLADTLYEFNTDINPLTEVNFEYDVRVTHRNKAQAHGSWPGHTFFGATLIHMTGELFGDDSSDFNANKFTLINTIMPDPLTFSADYPLGRVEIELDGMTEAAKADVSIDGDITLPIVGLSPGRAELQITWIAFSGYFIGVTSGDPYWLK